MTVVVDTTARPAPAAPPVVSVNGTIIPREAIAREIQNHPAAKPVDAWREAARALVVRELLLQEARRLDVAADPKADEAGRRETDEEALIRILIEREVVTPEPDEASCRRFYERNPARFRSPDIHQAAHILFAARQDEAEAFDAARRQAEAVLAELRLRPARFGEFAARYSACPSGPQGGNLGQITAGETTPEFERALFALAPGRISDSPVVTRYGFHIIRLDRKIEGRLVPFDVVAARIADYLREAVTRRATAQYIARLVSRAEIKGVAIDGAAEHRVN